MLPMGLSEIESKIGFENFTINHKFRPSSNHINRLK